MLALAVAALGLAVAAPDCSARGPVCPSYGRCEPYLFADARCVCRCAGQGDWPEIVRCCLLDLRKQDVDPDLAHALCWGAATVETGVRRFSLPLSGAAELAGSGWGGGGSSLQPAAPLAARTSAMEQSDLTEIIRGASSAGAGTAASCLSRRRLQHRPTAGSCGLCRGKAWLELQTREATGFFQLTHLADGAIRVYGPLP